MTRVPFGRIDPHSIRESANRQRDLELREHERQTQRWQEAIEANPSFSAGRLQKTALAMRQLLSDFRTRPFHVRTLDDLERLEMELLCDAIRGGAFAGDDWRIWRMLLRDKPHILNAFHLLGTHRPQGYPEPPLAQPGRDQDVIIPFIAMMVETFAKTSNEPRADTNIVGAIYYSSRWFTKNTRITSEQLRQEKFKGRLGFKKSKGQNLYSHADAVRLWGEDAMPEKPL